ncbi:hypothetical protein PAPYR_12569 [Paratrimastix pyriformis]|uniref:Peptidase S74 domain-containing protein n=1 Tax=Paratrimastix pyriformis TaxID=342808 RepID=A0ABQ8U5A4_9EUKA|nr:hypothetical protein PAPYR_12569 [Paratrimastix pyriformis]
MNWLAEWAQKLSQILRLSVLKLTLLHSRHHLRLVQPRLHSVLTPSKFYQNFDEDVGPRTYLKRNIVVEATDPIERRREYKKKYAEVVRESPAHRNKRRNIILTETDPVKRAAEYRKKYKELRKRESELEAPIKFESSDALAEALAAIQLDHKLELHDMPWSDAAELLARDVFDNMFFEAVSCNRSTFKNTGHLLKPASKASTSPSPAPYVLELLIILQNATSVVASTYPIRPPSAPTREKLVLTMNDLSDSMFSINGGIGKIFRPDATRALVINSIASESYTTMSSALKLTYGGYTTGFVSRAADGVLSMTTGSATATNSSIVLRDATGASAFTTLSTSGAATIGGVLTVPSVASAGNLVASERFEHNVRRVLGWLNCGICGAVNFAVNTSGASYSRGNHIIGGSLTVGGTTSASLLGTDSTGLVVARTASINSVINTYALRAGDGSCGFHKVTGPVGSTLRLVMNGTDPNWGMYYSAVGATALNTNIYAPGCSPIGLTGPAIHLSTYNADSAGFVYESTSGTSGTTAVPQFAVNALSGNTYVNGTLTVNGTEMRIGSGAAASVANTNALTMQSDQNVVVISADVSGAIYAANSSNPSIFLRAEGVDVIKLNKTKFYSLVARQTTLDTDGLDLRIDNDGKIGLPASAAKYKTDIVNMEDTSSLYRLRPVNFRYRSDPSGAKCYGLIADEAVTVCPDLVRMKDGEVEGLYDHKLQFMLLNEIQKQHATIVSLQAQVDDLRSGMAALLEVSIFSKSKWRHQHKQSAQVKALQADLQARSGAATVMEPVNVPPPPTLAVDPAGVPNPPVEPTDEIVEIEFADKVKRNIKASWQRQVPLLASSKIMRSSLKFDRYIFPLLNGDTLRWSEDVDTKRELGEMVEELRCYGMALSEGQLQSVSDGSGFTRQINKVRDYINSHETACFNRSYRNATTQFAAQWDRYVAVLGAKLQCEKMESLKFTLLRDTVVSKDIYSLLDLNLKYRNVVYEFFDWFDAFVIRGDREGLVRRTVDVALNIDMSVLNGASDVMSIVSNILTSFKGANINKETIIAKLASIAQAQIASRNNFRKYVISYAKAEARRFRKPPENPPYRMNEAEKAAVKQAYQAAKAGDRGV